MVLHSLAAYGLRKDFLTIPIFDILIGNTDRHHSNWAVLQREQSFKLCPLYDNGSFLCCYIPETQLASYLGNDRLRFQALVDSKSRSRIRINKKMKKEPTHLEVLHFLRVYHYYDVIGLVKTIQANIQAHNIDSLLGKYDTLLSTPRRTLIKKFLFAKVRLMAREFKLGEEGETSLKDRRDYIYLAWQEPSIRRHYIVGQLTKNSQYEFSYGYEVEEALQKGFKLLIPFAELHKVYQSDTLFPLFPAGCRTKKEGALKKFWLNTALKNMMPIIY